MIQKAFKIIKSEVVEEVAEATAYTGAKMTGNTEEGAVNGLDEVATVDEDAEMLVRRFGSEARAGFVERMAGMVTDDQEGDDYWSFLLELSSAWNRALYDSMKLSLQSYFVWAIAARWFAYTNKTEAQAYADKAQAFLEDFRMKAYEKRRPERPVYN